MRWDLMFSIRFHVFRIKNSKVWNALKLNMMARKIHGSAYFLEHHQVRAKGKTGPHFPWGKNPFESSEWVRRRVLDALAGKEWVAIGALYLATSRRVKRDLLHATLKRMLAAREIRMRMLPVNGARDRTEFRLLANV